MESEFDSSEGEEDSTFAGQEMLSNRLQDFYEIHSKGYRKVLQNVRNNIP